jgi:hypothetical protein
MALEKIYLRLCTGFIWLRIGAVTDSCEHGYEYLVSMKGGEFIE